jgi:hypothetical protein
MKLLSLLFFCALSQASPQGVPVQSTFTCTTSNQAMLAQNNSRGYLIFQNQGTSTTDSTSICHFKAGAAITGTEGLIVKAGQNYETVEAFTKQPWYCKCDVSSQTIEILQTNY